MSNNIKLIIFDLDGTLVDSAHEIIKAVNYMRRYFNKSELSSKEIMKHVGNGPQYLLKGTLELSTDEEINNAVKIFAKYYENECISPKLYPNVKEVLQKLKESNINISIISNKLVKLVEKSLKIVGIWEFFKDSVILGGDSLPTRKPNKEPFLFVCHKYNIPPQQSLMVGDGEPDIIGGRNINMNTCAVSYGYTPREKLEKLHPDYIIDNFKELYNILL